MKLVRITPYSIRAKNRVKEHGEIMILIHVSLYKFLVKSVDKTFNNSTEHWLGWFSNSEASFEEV